MTAPSSNAEGRLRWSASLMNNYGTPPFTLVAGRGATVVDADGNEYLDLLAGIAVNCLGHAHPAVIAAVTSQLSTLGHTSNLSATPPTIALAERLLELAGRDGKVFFGNSGAEANEAAFKIGRLTGRGGYVAAAGGFHGRTMGALALTGQPAKQAPFEPLPPSVSFVPFGDSEALAAAVSEQTAAVVLEPVQGEGGVIPAPPGYLAAAGRIAQAAGALLVLDEVQTGVGRTGEWFAHTADGAQPDIVTLAKGLGGGLPVGATIAFGDAAGLLGPGSHGSTFGGNPVSCAAALAVLDTIESDCLLARATQLGDRLQRELATLPGVDSVRGRGLLLGVVLTPGLPAAAVEVAARQQGLLVNAVAREVIRLAPPLVLTDDEADRAIQGLADAIAEVAAATVTALDPT
ncbi:MAG: acetylornithine/N-succinyldiaminopimelate aminotransferase [Actinomycetota bacterium]|nr:acetylornithine/N-succinyldiaminopimelate aminotransferase [Actinomycetota bacterium]